MLDEYVDVDGMKLLYKPCVEDVQSHADKQLITYYSMCNRNKILSINAQGNTIVLYSTKFIINEMADSNKIEHSIVFFEEKACVLLILTQ